MSEQVEIKKIVIKIGEKEATLTPDEARELRDALAKLFGEKENAVTIMPIYPLAYPVYPTYTYRWWDVQVTCNTLYVSSTGTANVG